MKKTFDAEKFRRWEKIDALQRASVRYAQGGLPAFPKPHIRPIGGGRYECKRHVFQDEFLSATGDSAQAAYDVCFLEMCGRLYDRHFAPFDSFLDMPAPDAPWWRFWK